MSQPAREPDYLCPWCRSDLEFHCGATHPTCLWVRCELCETLIDFGHERAVDRKGNPLPWPYTTPDQATD